MPANRKEWPLIIPKKRPGVAYSKTPLTLVMAGNINNIVGKIFARVILVRLQ